jgi:hypothetical protein
MGADIRLENVTEGTFVPDSSGFETTIWDGGSRTHLLVEATDASGDTLELQMKALSGNSGTTFGKTWWLATGQHTHDVAISDHSHPVDPGVTEFPNETASSCDVIVNGSTTDNNVGTGEFETTVDLSGELNTGAWNTVEVSSDSLGLLMCSMGIAAYRQIGSQ